MNKITILAAFILFSITLSAQKIKYYNVWITTDSGIYTGYLYSADKQSLQLIDNLEHDATNLTSIAPADILKIKIRKKGRVGKSILIGGGAGIITGAVVGAALGSGEEIISQSGATIGTAVLFGVIGAAVGTGVGLHKKKLNIEGNTKVYEGHLPLLRNFSVNK